MTAVADETYYETLGAELGPLRLPGAYCPIEPTPVQDWFLRQMATEVFFGGAAGPGKSWGLLMSALQFVDYKTYHAVLLRPTLGEFEQPGGLIEVAHDWLGQTDAWWHGGRREWRFPSGATLRFGYLRNVQNLKQFKGPSYSFVGFDELTSFAEQLYRGVFRVLRQARGELDDVPLRMRAASNPGDVGHDWVKTRFVDPFSRADRVVFVPATIHDNPHLDYDTYVRESLGHMHPVDQQRLIDGDWDVTEAGGTFSRRDFNIVGPGDPDPPVASVRYWDFAATEPSPSNHDPDYTVGLLLEVSETGRFTVRSIVRGRWTSEKVEAIVRETANLDGPGIPIFVEQEPGSSGKIVLSHYKRKVLAGFACHAGLTKGQDKEVRARPVAAAVANGLVDVVRSAGKIVEFLDETERFPRGGHDDQVDALSGAHTALTRVPATTGQASTAMPEGQVVRVSDQLDRYLRR